MDHSAGEFVELPALAVGDGDLFDLEIGEHPLQVFGGPRPSGRQALVEVPAGKERSHAWMRQCRHAGELYWREVGRLVDENLIAVQVQDWLQRRPSWGIDILEDRGAAQQVACCPKNGQQHNIELKRIKIPRFDYMLGIPAAFLAP